MSLELAAWILLPLGLFLLGAAAAAVRGIIRFEKYMVTSEAAQAETARTNQQIADRLEAYMSRTDDHLGDIDQDVAVLKYAVGHHRGGNGTPKPRRPAPGDL